MNLKSFALLVLALIIITGLGILFWMNYQGVWPAIRPPADRNATSSPDGSNTTAIPLTVPTGFSISVFAKDLPGARVMAFDYFNNMWVSQPSEGAISTLEIQNGSVVRQNAVFRDLKNPHGIAIDPDNGFAFYIAEENKISRIGLYSDGPLEKIADLASGGRHTTRTIEFDPNPSTSSSTRRLYVSIGSSCDVCRETNDQRAKIFSMNKMGGDFKEFAHGLRNAVFFTWNPLTNKMWATDMGRDNLGDNIPPDEINIIEAGKNYGWPICYGKNIHDTDFDKNTYIRNPCMEPFETQSFIDLQAHSAPLGLAFVPDSWPAEYKNDLIVAYHGSWNRSTPTGYKLVRVKLDENGNYLGIENFITGWFADGKTHGTPAGLLFGPDGSLYVSDDHAGIIYRIQPKENT